MSSASQTIAEELRRAGWPFKSDGGGYILDRADSRFSIRLASGDIDERLDIGERWHLVVRLSPGNPASDDEAAMLRLPKLDTAIFRIHNDHEQQYVRWAPFSSHYANADPLRVSKWVAGALGTISERLIIEQSDYVDNGSVAEESLSVPVDSEQPLYAPQPKPIAYTPSEGIRSVLNSIPDLTQRITTLNVLIQQGIASEADAGELRDELLLQLHDPIAIESVVMSGGVISQEMAEDFILKSLASDLSVNQQAMRKVCSDEARWTDRGFEAKIDKAIASCRSRSALSALFEYMVDYAPSALAFRVGMRALQSVTKETSAQERVRIVEVGTSLSGKWSGDLVRAALESGVVRPGEACASSRVAKLVGEDLQTTNEVVRQTLIRGKKDDVLLVLTALQDANASQLLLDSLAKLLVWLGNKGIGGNNSQDERLMTLDVIERIADLHDDYTLGDIKPKLLSALRALQQEHIDADTGDVFAASDVFARVFSLVEPSAQEKVVADALMKEIDQARQVLADKKIVVVGGRPPAHIESVLESFGLSKKSSIHWVRASRDKAPSRDEVWAPVTGGRCAGVLNVLDCGHRTSDLAKQASTSAGIPLVQSRTNSRKDLQNGFIKLAAAIRVQP